MLAAGGPSPQDSGWVSRVKNVKPFSFHAGWNRENFYSRDASCASRVTDPSGAAAFVRPVGLQVQSVAITSQITVATCPCR